MTIAKTNVFAQTRIQCSTCGEWALPERLNDHNAIAGHDTRKPSCIKYFEHDTMARLRRYEQQIVGRRPS